MEFEHMTLKREAGVATLTLDRADKLNAMTTGMWKDFLRILEIVGDDDELKALILTGVGRAFCTGSDVQDRLAGRLAGRKVDATRRDLLGPVGYPAYALRTLDKITIAAVNGMAVGAGLSIALFCDIRLASASARFGAIWVKMGLVPDLGASYALPRIVGTSKALQLMTTGEMVGATEAKELGLVSEVMPGEELMPAAAKLASRIAGGPSVAIELMKRAVYKGIHNDLLGQLDFEGYAQNICRYTEDHKEAVEAFLEKREARFKGK